MNKKVITSGVWYTISSFLINSISIITTPLFTRILTMDEYGGYSNFTAAFSILSVIVTLNMHSTLIRAQFDFENEKEKYTSTIIIVSMSVSVLCLLLSQIFYEPVSKVLGVDRFGLIIMFLSLIFFPAINIFQGWQIIKYEYKKNVLISFLCTVGNVLFSVAFIYSFSNKLHGRILGSQLMTIVIGAGIVVIYLLRGKSFKWEYAKYALKICLPFIPHLLALTILNLFDKIMITNICGKSANALYSLAVNCALIMTILISALNSAFSPWIGEQLHKRNLNEIRKVSYWYILIFFLVAIGNMLFAPEILDIFGGDRYMGAVVVIPPIVLGGMCQLLYTLYVNIEQYEKKTMGMAAASCLAALLNYLLNLWLIPIYGYVAAAYTTFFSYLCLLIMHYLLVKRMKLAKAYDTKYVFFIIVILFIISQFMLLLYKCSIIRYVICAIYIVAFIITGIVVLKNRDKILAKINGEN